MGVVPLRVCAVPLPGAGDDRLQGGELRRPAQLLADAGRGGHQARRITRTPGPQYTEAARKARITGLVIIQTIIGCDGRLTHFRLLKSLDPGLDQESFETLSQWRYDPARLDGIPVSAFFNFTVNFQLQAAAQADRELEPQVTVEGRLIDPRR